jgi:subfamily B ATP-binding cassette protein MsbA
VSDRASVLAKLLRLEGKTLPIGRRMWRDWVKPYCKLILFNLALIGGVSAATASFPLIVRWALDRFQANDLGPLAWMPLLIVLATGTRAATLYGHLSLTNLIASYVTRDLQNAMFARLTHADLLQLGRESPAALSQRFATEFHYVDAAVRRAITSLIRDLLMIVALVGTMIWIDWRLSLVGAVIAPIAILPVAWIGQKLRDTARRTAQEMGGMSSVVAESLAGARMVKSYRLEDAVTTRARGVFDGLHGLRVKAANQFARVEPILEVIGGVAVAIVLMLIGARLASGESNIGDFAGFVTALLIAAQPMRTLGNANSVIQEGIGALERVFAIIDRAPLIVEAPGARPLAVAAGEIRFTDVTFRFHDGATALDGVSLTVPAGKTVALVGRSGSGTSTLFNLVPRLYDTTSGVVAIDGQDVRGVTLSSLRDAIALVTQEAVIFYGTVTENIAFGRAGADRTAIEAAARAAAAHDFIARLPMGYDTVLGAEGVGLSGGERQRLALARALLKDAPILLLDEATAALDAESESLVQEALARLTKGRTTLVIAHRLSTVRDADLIVVLDQGRVVETGPHDALLASDGAYASLYKLQFKDA